MTHSGGGTTQPVLLLLSTQHSSIVRQQQPLCFQESRVPTLQGLPALSVVLTQWLAARFAVAAGPQHRRVLLPPDARRLGQDWPQAVCCPAVCLPGLCQWRAMHCVALEVLQEGWRWPDLLLHGQHLWWLLRVTHSASDTVTAVNDSCCTHQKRQTELFL